MPKLPFTQFYVADWLSDTAPLSPQARGVWIDLICFLWRSEKRGTLTYPKEVWMRLLRLDQLSFDTILEELSAFRICNVSCNASITIESRRIIRDEKKRENNRIRVDKWRSNHASNESVTPLERLRNTVSNGDIQKQKLETEAELESEAKKERKSQRRSVSHSLGDRDGSGFTPLIEEVIKHAPKWPKEIP